MPAKTKSMTFESEIKSFDDKELIIEHFISTEQRDRSKDVVRADGITFDGIPAVLKQHGLDEYGNEPIAKPIEIYVGTNSKGIKGVIAKTQYYNGSHLTPPDNTGQRLYEKAKNGFMPYWSIRFRSLEEVPISDGGFDIKKSVVYEYSQVGVPDNPGADIIKSLDEDLEKNSKELITFGLKQEEKAKKYKCECIECGYKMETDEHCADIKCPECKGQMRREKRPGTGQKDMKSISERISIEIPYNAMNTIWYAFTYELYSAKDEKEVKGLLKEFVELVTPYAVEIINEINGNEEKVKEFQDKLTKITSIESPSDSAQGDEIKTADTPKTPPIEKPVTVLRLKAVPKYKLPCDVNTFQKMFKDTMSETIKEGVDKIKGKVS